MIIVWGIVILVGVVISFHLQVLVHEVGHMVAGLLTGWKLIYLQFFHIVLAKDKGIFLYMVPSSACQCIMSPKCIEYSSYLYTMGGLIVNLITTCISIYSLFLAYDQPMIFILSLCFFASGIALLLVNGVPNFGRVCNDMACYILNSRDSHTRYFHNAQLMIAKELSEGRTYREVKKSLICLSKQKVDNDILAYQAVLEYYYHLDRDEYSSAREAIEKADHGMNVSYGVQKIINLELLYLDMVMDIVRNEKRTIYEERYANDIVRYINRYESKGDIHFLRINGLWEAYSNYLTGDYTLSVECLDKTITELNDSSVIYRGELVFCLDQMFGIKNIMIRTLRDEVFTSNV